MKRGILTMVAAAVAAMTGHADAQAVKSTVTASNGVEIIKSVDEFAGRYEFLAPREETKSAKGAFVSSVVAKVKAGGQNFPTSIQGFIIYYGDWRRFDYAVFRGGDPVNYKNTDKDVGSCRNGCQLTESFIIELSPEDIAKHAEGGKVPIQIRSQGSDTVMLEIPVAYVEAVNEIAR
jgi:hypothetical protein